MMQLIRYSLLLLCIGGLFGCNYFIGHKFRQDYKEAGALLHKDSIHQSYLKAHMKNGDVYVFKNNNWKIDETKTMVAGDAIQYNFKRLVVAEKYFSVPINDVAIFETNEPIQNKDAGRVIALAILTGADLIGDLYCITNPKACFGSCPTFYYQRDNNINYANAEGFSSSICPSLEAGDIDALNNTEQTKGEFVLTMKNEALETHAVNQVKLFAVPRQKGHRIFNGTDDNFYDCRDIVGLTNASAQGTDITNDLQLIDDREYYSATDSSNLPEKETVNISITNTRSENGAGIILNFRQTLLTTFLLYSAYGYMGDEAGDMFANIETSSLLRKKLSNPYNILGGIDIMAWNNKAAKWQLIQTIYETGPIARNLQFVPLPDEVSKQKDVKIQLRMCKGCWRIDYAALGVGVSKIDPTEVLPSKVIKNGQADKDALANMQTDDKQYEASVPGDRYQLYFDLPVQNDDYELFVYSKGYYLEWIRKEWLAEKNLPKLKGMITNNKDVWRSLATEFKMVEGKMESTFWGSKISGTVTK